MSVIPSPPMIRTEGLVVAVELAGESCPAAELIVSSGDEKLAGVGAGGAAGGRLV